MIRIYNIRISYNYDKIASIFFISQVYSDNLANLNITR